MDELGTLVYVMQLDDKQFQQRMANAIRTSESTARSVEKALSALSLDVDVRRFTGDLRSAEQVAERAGERVATHLRGLQLSLDDRGFVGSLRDAPRTAAEATQRIVRSFDGIGQAADDSARRVRSASTDSSRSLAGTADAGRPLVLALGDVGQAAEGMASQVRRSADQSAQAVRATETAAKDAQRAQEAYERSLGGVASTLDKQTGALTDASRQWVANKVPDEYLRSLEQAGINTQRYLDAVLGSPAALAEMRSALSGNEDAVRNLDRAQSSVREAQEAFARRQRAVGAGSAEAEEATARAARTVQEAGETSARATPLVTGMGNAFDNAKTAMVGLLAAGTLIDFFKTAVDRASDLSETVSKNTQIFGESAAGVEEWGNTAAKAMGISKAEALDAASNFGNMFQQLGWGREEAAKLSQEVVQMSADLGSFNNLGTSDVIDRISGAMRGEYDSLQLLIPNINAARVEQEAMQETGKQNADALTAQEKAHAVLAIVQKDGAAAMGDFARTADGVANTQKTATASFKEAQTEIGDRLLPVAKELLDLFQKTGVPAIEAVGGAFSALVGFLAPVVELFAGAPGPVQAMALALGAVVLFNGPLLGMSGTLTAFVGRLRAAAGAAATFGVAAKGALAALGGPIGLAIIGITTALSLFSSSSDEAEEAAVDLGEAIDKQTGKWKSNASAVVAAKVESNGLADAYRKAGGDAADLVAAITGVPGAQDKVNAVLDQARAAAKAAGVEYDSLGRITSGSAKANQEYVTSYNQTSAAAQANSAQARAAGEAQELLNGVIGEATRLQEEAARTTETASGALQRQAVEAQGTAAGLSGLSYFMSGLVDESGKAADPLKFLAEALEKNVEQAKILADNTEAQRMLNDTAGAADNASRAFDIFSDAMDRASGRQIPLEEAAASWNDDIRSVAAAWKEASEQGDLNYDALMNWNVAALTATTSGKGLYDSLTSQYGTYKDYTAAAYSAAYETGGVAAAQEAARAKATELRQAFIDNNAEMLGGRDKAAALADQLNIVDGTNIDQKTFDIIANDQQARNNLAAAKEAEIANKNFLITADAASAQSQADALNKSLDTLNGRQVTWHAIGNITVAVDNQAAQEANNKAVNFGYGAYNYGPNAPRANGGWIGLAAGGFSDGTSGWVTGPGGPTDDLVVAQGPNGKQVRVSPDEFVVRASQARQWGGLLEAINSGAIMRAGGGWIGLAGGGDVGSAPAGSSPVTGPVVAAPVAADVAAEGADPASPVPNVEAAAAAWAGMQAAAEAANAGITASTVAMQVAVQASYDLVNAGAQGVGEKQAWLAAETATQQAATLAAVQGARTGMTAEQDVLMAGLQAVGDKQWWLRDLTVAQWAQQGEGITAHRSYITGQIDVLNAGLQGLGDKQSWLAGTTTVQWGSIGATISGVQSGQIAPAWTAVQGFHQATGDFFAGISAGISGAATTVTGDIATIRGELDSFFQLVDGRSGTTNTANTTSVTVTTGGGLQALADGGEVTGLITQGSGPRSDDVNILASRGEYVVKEPVARRHRKLLDAINFGGAFADGGVVGESIARPLQSTIEQSSQAAVTDAVQKALAAYAATFATASGFNASQDPSSFGWVRAANIVPYSFEGTSFPSGVAKGTEGLWNSLLSFLVPQIPGGLLPGQNWGFQNRDNVNSPGNASFHSYGLALDINSAVNANGTSAASIQGRQGAIPIAPAQEIASKLGMLWGGDFSGTPDPMHFEIHVSPQDISGVSSSPAPGTDGSIPLGAGWMEAVVAKVKNATSAAKMSTSRQGVSGLLPIAPGPVDSYAGIMRSLNTVDPMVDFGPMNMARGRAEWVGPVPPGGAVDRWRPLYRYALMRKGKYSQGAEDNITHQMDTESTGDPLAYNDWDRNFTGGHPSKSLLQTIPSTFKAYAEPGYNTNIWDPLSNAFAAINYVDRNYDGVFPGRAYRHGGQIFGPGGPQDDAVPIRASNGEFMVNALSAAANGPLLRAINSTSQDVLAGAERAAWAGEDPKKFDPADLAAFGQPTIEPRIEIVVNMAADGGAPSVAVAVDGRKMAGALVRVQGRR